MITNHKQMTIENSSNEINDSNNINDSDDINDKNCLNDKNCSNDTNKKNYCALSQDAVQFKSVSL